MLNPNSECLHTIRDRIAAGFYQNRVRVLAEAGSDEVEIQREAWAKQDKICFDNFFKDLVEELVLNEDCNNSLQHMKNMLQNNLTIKFNNKSVITVQDNKLFVEINANLF